MLLTSTSGNPRFRCSRFANWPLRLKVVAILLFSSALPLVATAYLDVQQARVTALASEASQLSSWCHQLAAEFDRFNDAHLSTAKRLARLPDVRSFATSDDHHLRETLAVWSESDEIRGIALLDTTGTVRIATNEALAGKSLASRAFVQHALRGDTVISDVHLAEPEVGGVPSIAYVSPVLGDDGAVLGLLAVWVHAEALWDLARSTHALGRGPTYAVLVDEAGVRIAHSMDPSFVFRPTGPLPAVTIDAMVVDARFGPNTRALLSDVEPFPEVFRRATSLERGVDDMFLDFSTANERWSYGVGCRLTSTPWTLFYLVPREQVEAPIIAMTRVKVAFSAAVIGLALTAGGLLASSILPRVAALARATERLGKGDFTARVEVAGSDEIGRLGESFNAMAERIQAQDAGLRRARDESEAFSYSVAHDLRTPLRAINGFSTALIEDQCGRLDAEALDHLERIRTSALRMGHMIDALLELARVSRAEIHRQPVDLTALGRAVFAQLVAAEPARKVEFVVQEGLHASGDCPLIRVVLENLLGNAWKFTSGRPVGRIELGCTERDGVPTYYVRDNGAGFDMAYSGKLFTPFQRLHRPTEFAGSGIGLATVQRIVTRHGGAIWADGDVGRGATFYFTLGEGP
jgi:signal transduction histidine kinase